jgi:chaperonin GroEL
VEEGIVAGGGVALVRAKQKISNLLTTGISDQDAGVQIVLRAMESPLRTIVWNAGGSPDVVVNSVMEGSGNFGYNAANDTYGDLVEMGVIDPTKVTKTALVNAASVAGMLLTTGCSIAEIPRKDEPAMPGGGMPGMM